jgi:hypothetical protein
MERVKALRVCRVCYKVIVIREGSRVSVKPICKECKKDK